MIFKLNSLTQKILTLFAVSFMIMFLILIIWHIFYSRKVIDNVNVLANQYFEKGKTELVAKQEEDYKKYLKAFNDIIIENINNGLENIIFIKKLVVNLYENKEIKEKNSFNYDIDINKFSRIDSNAKKIFSPEFIFDTINSVLLIKNISASNFINEITFLNSKSSYFKKNITGMLDFKSGSSVIDLLKKSRDFFYSYPRDNNNLMLINNIRVDDNRNIGVICTKLNLNKLMLQVERFLDLTHIGYFIITDNKFNILFSHACDSDEKRLAHLLKIKSNMLENLACLNDINNMGQESDIFQPFEYNSEEYFLQYSKINQVGWNVILIVSKKDMMFGLIKLEEGFNEIKNICIEKYLYLLHKNIYYIFSILISAFIVIAILFLVMIKKTMKPLKFLRKAVNLVGQGKIRQKVPCIKTGDEVEELSLAFNRMTNDLNSYIKNLAFTIREKEKIVADIETAAEIQLSALPKRLEFTEDGQEKYIDISSCCIPSKFIAGDFFDYFMIENNVLFDDNNHLFFTIGDVSGKGVPAALFMMTIKTILKNYLYESVRKYSLEEILLKVNNALGRDNKSFMFATMFCGILDLKTGKASCVSAAHNPPLVYRKATGKIEEVMLLESTIIGTPLKNVFFATITFDLDHGDVLFLYTDGLTDLQNRNEQYFGKEKLIKCFSEIADKSALEIKEKITETIKSFSVNNSYNDDVTYLTIKYK